MSSNDRFDIAAAQPSSDEQRAEIANQCCEQLKMQCPMVIDGINNAVCDAYAAFPDRLYLIDANGRIAYKGGRGPFGYRPLELEQSIIMTLLDQERKGSD